jgi:hypothetical protein
MDYVVLYVVPASVAGRLQHLGDGRIDPSHVFTDSCHLDDGGAKILGNVGSYKSHTA